MCRILDRNSRCVCHRLSSLWASMEPGSSGICCAPLQPGPVGGWHPPGSKEHTALQRTFTGLCTASSDSASYGGPWACRMLSSLPEIKDPPHRANSLTFPMPNCKLRLLCLLPALSLQSACSPGLPHSHYIFVQHQPPLLSFQLPPQGAPIIQVINNNNNNAEAGWIELDYSVAEFELDWLKAAHTPPAVILRASFSQCDVTPHSLKPTGPWGCCQHTQPHHSQKDPAPKHYLN